REQRKIGVDLDVPTASLHAFDRGLQALASDARIVDATGGEVDADAAYACFAHRVEIALRRLVVDHRNAAPRVATKFDALQGRPIVGSVDARGHDHHALDVQRLV